MEVTLEINGAKAKAILDTIKRIQGVEVKSVKANPTKKAHFDAFKEAYKQTELAEQGKIQLKTFDSLVDEL
uniref:Uncharacterized protein n=1 Tax=Sphingobacterium sp. (strain 21) TaxID=743722 RepID=F4CDC0_SPHS2